jgi:hypothetical protein
LISISEWLEPEAVRQFNLALFERGINYVEVDEAVDDRKAIRRKIMGVPTGRIATLLESLPAFRPEHGEEAWAHWMACAVSQQLWPDGNHRTAFLAFDAVARSAFDESISLPKPAIEPMLEGSKAILHRHWARPGVPVFTLDELADSGHVYRDHFRRFAPELVWRRA